MPDERPEVATLRPARHFITSQLELDLATIVARLQQLRDEHGGDDQVLADLEADALEEARRISAEDLGWEMDGEEPDDVR